MCEVYCREGFEGDPVGGTHVDCGLDLLADVVLLDVDEGGLGFGDGGGGAGFIFLPHHSAAEAGFCGGQVAGFVLGADRFHGGDGGTAAAVGVLDTLPLDLPYDPVVAEPDVRAVDDDGVAVFGNVTVTGGGNEASRGRSQSKSQSSSLV